jgi:hypothetical protein
VYTNYYNATTLAERLGIKKIYFLNYDYYLKNTEFLNNISRILNSKKAYFGIKEELEGSTVITFFLATNPKFYLDHIPLIKTRQEYDQLMLKWNSKSNGLENLTYCAFTKSKDQIHWEEETTFINLIADNFEHKDFSRVEYFSVIQVKDHPEQFAVFLNVSNLTDSRDIIIDVYEDEERLLTETIQIKYKVSWFRQVVFNPEKTYRVHYHSYDRHTKALVESKEVVVDSIYFDNQLVKNGFLTLL